LVPALPARFAIAQTLEEERLPTAYREAGRVETKRQRSAGWRDGQDQSDRACGI